MQIISILWMNVIYHKMVRHSYEFTFKILWIKHTNSRLVSYGFDIHITTIVVNFLVVWLSIWILHIRLFYFSISFSYTDKNQSYYLRNYLCKSKMKILVNYYVCVNSGTCFHVSTRFMHMWALDFIAFSIQILQHFIR